MIQALGQFSQNDVPRGGFRIENGHILVTGQRFDIAVLLEEKFGGDSILFDGFRCAVLPLQQSGVAHEALWWLRVSPQNASENCGGF